MAHEGTPQETATQAQEQENVEQQASALLELANRMRVEAFAECTFAETVEVALRQAAVSLSAVEAEQEQQREFAEQSELNAVHFAKLWGEVEAERDRLKDEVGLLRRSLTMMAKEMERSRE